MRESFLSLFVYLIVIVPLLMLLSLLLQLLLFLFYTGFCSCKIQLYFIFPTPQCSCFIVFQPKYRNQFLNECEIVGDSKLQLPQERSTFSVSINRAIKQQYYMASRHPLETDYLKQLPYFMLFLSHVISCILETGLAFLIQLLCGLRTNCSLALLVT